MTKIPMKPKFTNDLQILKERQISKEIKIMSEPQILKDH
jgi:hypothetical protein